MLLQLHKLLLLACTYCLYILQSFKIVCMTFKCKNYLFTRNPESQAQHKTKQAKTQLLSQSSHSSSILLLLPFCPSHEYGLQPATSSPNLVTMCISLSYQWRRIPCLLIQTMPNLATQHRVWIQRSGPNNPDCDVKEKQKSTTPRKRVCNPQDSML